MSDFVHLHCHSEYSLLDGAIRLGEMCQKAKNFGMPAVAVTDHGYMYAALKLYLEAKKFGLKPIIGSEVYVCDDHTNRTDPVILNQRYHLVLLAMNTVGYHNLTRIVTTGTLHGFYRRPRVDKRVLKEHSEGLICLSACMAGEIPRAISNGNMPQALALAREYARLFPDRFYLEIQSIGMPEQDALNEKLLEIAGETGLPLVATNDCHYLNADDADAHDILLCIQTGKDVSDPNRLRFDSRELYFKSPEEMEAAFAHVPEAIANTGRIAGQCGDYAFNFKDYHFPIYDVPAGMTLETEFRRLAKQGFEKRLEKLPYAIDRELYEQRLAWELDVICEMGFPGYFLIVQDFINWAKNNGVPVGPGRGSAAGSLVAYSLRITNLDPIPYNLLFERFLNNERVSMPDIDVDFCEANRYKVIEYVTEKYGKDSVSQITTFGKMLAKGVVRDVGRALGMSFAETDRIAKLIPGDPKMTIKKALELSPDLHDLYATDTQVTQLLDTALRLEGLVRHASIHAAGVVVSDRPMVEYLPLYRGKREEDRVTQYDMKLVEKVGLVKFDFLGLRNMTVIENALKNIARQGKEPPDLDSLPLDDEATYRLFSNGDTDGVFQLESSGMRKYLRMLKPSVFEDVIAMLALYRPGPLKSGMVDEFIKRKHGQIKVRYPLPSLEACLKDTYGVIVYQEQVMQIAQIVAGYTLGGADLLRRAMGKKDATAMQEERSKFITGALEREVEQQIASDIFDLMEKFAEYGFNKSHSAAYALITYYTAYLKAHFGTEFMSALLSSEMGNQDKLLKYVAACKDMGISVLTADVQKSDWGFTVFEDKIVFGLGGIKNVGEEAVRELVSAREESGPFTSLLDLCIRVPGRRITKRVLESLIKAGACDCFGVSRCGLLASLDAVVIKAQKAVKEKESLQISLFSMVPEDSGPATPGIGFDCPEQACPEWSNADLATYEKEALGFFFSSHPLQPFRKEILRQGLMNLEECHEMYGKTEIKAAVLVTAVKETVTKKGDRMAICQVEDLTAQAKCLFFPRTWAECRDSVKVDSLLYLEAHTNVAQNDEPDAQNDADEEVTREIEIIAAKVLPLEEACRASTQPVCIEMDEGLALAQDRLEELKLVLEKHRGTVPVHVLVRMHPLWCRLELSPAHAVRPGPELEHDLALWQKTGGPRVAATA